MMMMMMMTAIWGKTMYILAICGVFVQSKLNG